MSTYQSNEQNTSESLSQVKSSYGNKFENIISELIQNMTDVLKDKYDSNNPDASNPIKGLTCQYDTATICLDIGNGKEIFMKPVWVPVLYLDESQYPENVKNINLQTVKENIKEERQKYYQQFDFLQ